MITLTTDFGHRDNFVGVMKGVILSIHPQARIVDLANDLPPHDTAQAAFSIFTAYPFFPEQTIHVVVVDPGVGSVRSIIAARTNQQVFVAPDNGVLSYILEEDPFEIRRIENEEFMLPGQGVTFHGRDIMAPAAAHLAKGLPFDSVGPPLSEPVRLPTLKANVNPSGIDGRVVYVDRFGNLITNIPLTELVEGHVRDMSIRIGDMLLEGISGSYSSVSPGQYVALPGSSGYLEIARNRDRAEQAPRLTIGTPVRVTII